MNSSRIKHLNNEANKDGDYVLYWMQHSQRTRANHALDFSIQIANDLCKPLLVCFGLTDGFPEANLRHYSFMLEGLKEVKAELEKAGIGFIIVNGSPDETVLLLGEKASAIVTDRGYLRVERGWRQRVAEKACCDFYQIESDLIAPIEQASIKEEYSAATIRRKLMPGIERFNDLDEIQSILNKFKNNLLSDLEGIILDVDVALSTLDIDKSVPPVNNKSGGYSEAKKRLDEFIDNKLRYYDTLKNHPDKDFSSGLSAYLHFGQISPVEVYNAIKDIDSPGKEIFIDEQIVRRELAFNFVYYNDRYDSYDCVPNWAAQSLDIHKSDLRTWVYTLEQLEMSETHDPYWNAAQTQLRLTGEMHGYMRMYWGKKIIEWSKDPEEAFITAIYLNNKFALDGRDPNSFAGIAWCFGKHDRPWAERPIFGKIRYMNDKGLERKFDIGAYVEKIERIQLSAEQ